MALEQKLCKINLIWALYHNLGPLEHIFVKYSSPAQDQLRVETKSYVLDECQYKLLNMCCRIHVINSQFQIILNTNNLTQEEWDIINLYGLECLSDPI